MTPTARGNAPSLAFRTRGCIPLAAGCIAKGTVPIPGARNLQQAQQNLGALTWKLDAGDVAALDAACADIKPLAKSPFPEKDIRTGLKMFDS